MSGVSPSLPPPATNPVHRASQALGKAKDTVKTVWQSAVGKNPAIPVKAVEVVYRPFVWAILVGAMLLFKQGQETMKGEDGDRFAWLKILGQSAAGTLLLNHTIGIYPLIGLGLAAHRAGQQGTGLDQCKAVVNTLLPMFSAYLGVHAFRRISAGDAQLDTEDLYRALVGPTLKGENIQPKVDDLLRYLHDLGNAVDAAGLEAGQENVPHTLKQALHDLREKLKQDPQKQPRATGEKIPFTEIQTFRQEVAPLKTKVSQAFSALEEEAFAGLAVESRAAVQKLHNAVQFAESGLVKGIRSLNPWLGFLLGIIGGNWLAHALTGGTEKHLPGVTEQLRQKRFNVPLTPADPGWQIQLNPTQPVAPSPVQSKKLKTSAPAASASFNPSALPAQKAKRSWWQLQGQQPQAVSSPAQVPLQPFQYPRLPSGETNQAAYTENQLKQARLPLPGQSMPPGNR